MDNATSCFITCIFQFYKSRKASSYISRAINTGRVKTIHSTPDKHFRATVIPILSTSSIITSLTHLPISLRFWSPQPASSSSREVNSDSEKDTLPRDALQRRMVGGLRFFLAWSHRSNFLLHLRSLIDCVVASGFLSGPADFFNPLTSTCHLQHHAHGTRWLEEWRDEISSWYSSSVSLAVIVVLQPAVQVLLLFRRLWGRCFPHH